MTALGRTAWFVARMTRPPQLLLVVAVALLGVVMARARSAALDPVSVLTGLAVLVPIAASIHLVNEYADHETDAATTRTPFSGGSGALPESALPRVVALVAAGLAAAVGLIGALAAAASGLLAGPALVILILGLVGGWAYSVGPRPLAWHGLGEVANAFLGGMLLPLYGIAIARGPLDALAVLAFIPLALVVVADLLATTWPDRAADAAVGKRTLATRWSKHTLRRTYAAVVLLALGLLGLAALGPLPIVVAVASLTAAPLLGWGHRSYTRRESPLPTVVAMLWLIAVQFVGWFAVG